MAVDQLGFLVPSTYAAHFGESSLFFFFCADVIAY